MSDLEERLNELNARLSARASELDSRIAARFGGAEREGEASPGGLPRGAGSRAAGPGKAVDPDRPAAPPFHAAGTRYGLFVGLNEYDQGAYERLGCYARDPRTGLFIHPLRGCAHDARNMAAVCRDLGDWSDESVLIDSDARLSRVRDALRSLAGKAVPGDEVLLFFSCHGGPNPNNPRHEKSNDTVLCLHDGLYQEKDLWSDLSAFGPAVKVVVIIDACHSAGIFENTGVLVRGGSRAPAFFRPGRGRALPNVGWITAAGAEEASLDMGKGGYFASFTLVNSGWRGGMAEGADEKGAVPAGHVSFYDLARFAQATWKEWMSYDAEDRKWVPHVPKFSNESLLRSVIAGRTGVPADEGDSSTKTATPKETSMNKQPKNFTEPVDLDASLRNRGASAPRNAAEPSGAADSVRRAASSSSALSRILKTALGRGSSSKGAAREYKEYIDCSFGTIQG